MTLPRTVADVMHEYLDRFPATEGVLFIGRAQEKNTVFRTEKRHGSDGRSYPWIVRTTAMVNQWYFYWVNVEFGPFFLKFSSYFPYGARLRLNGHEYAQRQASHAGIGFTALDNGFATVTDPDAVQAIGDALTPAKIDALLRKWLAILAHPFSPADRAAGYRYQLSVLQAEFSPDPGAGQTGVRAHLFDQVIRDNLDVGRPHQVGLIFNR